MGGRSGPGNDNSYGADVVFGSEDRLDLIGRQIYPGAGLGAENTLSSTENVACASNT
jgi:hypothetical protein